MKKLSRKQRFLQSHKNSFMVKNLKKNLVFTILTKEQVEASRPKNAYNYVL